MAKKPGKISFQNEPKRTELLGDSHRNEARKGRNEPESLLDSTRFWTANLGASPELSRSVQIVYNFSRGR